MVRDMLPTRWYNVGAVTSLAISTRTAIGSVQISSAGGRIAFLMVGAAAVGSAALLQQQEGRDHPISALTTASCSLRWNVPKSTSCEPFSSINKYEKLNNQRETRHMHESQETSNLLINSPNNKKSILIVGCGLTGTLVARQLVLSHRQQQQQQSSDHSPLLSIEMVERASYPAGRFGATCTYHNTSNITITADLGAQVLSTVNPNDFRALGGHGVTKDNLWQAHAIVQGLLEDGVLQQVSDAALGTTEERMLWEDLWQHYSATRGMTSVLQALLPVGVTPQFGVRIDQIVPIEDGKLQAKGMCRIQDESGQIETSFLRVYDVVIVCIPAPNVLEIRGVAQLLDTSSKHVLEQVGYDSRTCEAHFFDAQLRPALAKLFTDRLEISVEDDDDDNVEDGATHQISKNFSYLAWQDPKRGVAQDDEETPCAIVAHSKATTQPERPPLPLHKLDEWLSDATELPLATIQGARLFQKSIPWEVSQMIRPMEAVIADPPINSAWQCLTSSTVTPHTFVVAGDFMTQSSFVGCVATASAAARAALEQYIQRDKTQSHTRD